MVIRNGSVQLFRVAGITVFLHWSWLLVAAYQIQFGKDAYTSMGWNALEYVAIFAIVLMHEFGHAFACRSVGGKSERIMLWPLGGIAFVSPPMRPGALLWSIFAGPLVNMVLLPLLWFGASAAWAAMPDTNFAVFAERMAIINIIVLVFNILPIYPLDGGQILQSLLWFVMGYINSLRVVSIIGILGAMGLIGYAFYIQAGFLFYAMALYLGFQAYSGFQLAQYLSANRVNVTPPGPLPSPGPQQQGAQNSPDRGYKPPQF